MDFKKTAKATGIANLIIPLLMTGVTFGELGLMGLAGFRFNLETISFFGISLSALNIIAYAVYFILWFKFLGLLNEEYKENRNVRTAVIFGYFGNGVLLTTIFMGVCSTLFVVAFKQDNINITGLPYGVFPKEILNVNSIFRMISSILMLFMYLFLYFETEKESPLRTVLLLVSITILLDVITTRFPLAFVDVIALWASLVLEFIFFIQISNGQGFRKNESLSQESVSLSE